MPAKTQPKLTAVPTMEDTRRNLDRFKRKLRIMRDDFKKLQVDNTAKHNLLADRQGKIDIRDEHIELLEKKLVSYDEEASTNFSRIRKLERDLEVAQATLEMLVNALRSSGTTLRLQDNTNQSAARPMGAGQFPPSPRTKERDATAAFINEKMEEGLNSLRTRRNDDGSFDALYGFRVSKKLPTP